MPDPAPAQRLVAQAAELVGRYRRQGGSPRELLAQRAGDRDQVAAAELASLFYGVVAHRRRLEYALEAAPDWSLLAPAAQDVVVVLAFAVSSKTMTTPAAAQVLTHWTSLPMPWPSLLAVDQRIAAEAEPARRFGLQHSMTDAWATTFLAEYGERAAAVAAALLLPAPRTIRANLLRIGSREVLATELTQVGVATKPTAFGPHGLHVTDATPLFTLPAFCSGQFEQQDEGSQLVAQVVAPPPRGRVLDACAGSGGKTLALAASLLNRGELLATEVHDGRRRELELRCRRAGTSNVRTLATSEHDWPEPVCAFAARADRILLDVPCSGVGSWRRRPEARWTLQPDAVPPLLSLQAELLDRAASLLKPGARLVYSTCTLFAAENEAQVAALRARRPELELVRVAEILGGAVAAPITDPSGTYLQLLPHVHGTDGFFAAVLRRPR